MSSTTNDKSTSLGDQRRLLVFSLASNQFAIALSQVKEVIALPQVTSIPNSPPYFLGVTNLRGQILSILDLRKKLNIACRTDKETTVIVLDLANAALGVVVDAVDYVLNLKAGEQIAQPTLQRNSDNDCIEGVIHRDKALILFLDLAKALNASDRLALEVAQAQRAAA